MLVQEAVSPIGLVTADEFEIFVDLPENRERLLELINGAIVEKMPTEEHNLIGHNIDFALGTYNRQHKLGRVGFEVRQQ